MPPRKSPDEKSFALITGASRGIGLELAKECAKHGHDVVLVARRQDALEAAAGQIEGKYGVRAIVLPADLTDPAAPSEISAAMIEQEIVVHMLINNAGFGLGGEFLETDIEREIEMIQVNVTALTQLTKLFVRSMVKLHSGRIMNVASTAAFQPGPLMSVYYATKAYVLSFSEAIAEELRNTGVTVTALCPGATATDFAETAQISNSRLFRKLGVADAGDVARYGYKAMMRGDRVAIPGWRDKLMIQSERFAPRRLITAIARKAQESR
jgi:short-subunit dehydrogenase